MMATEDRPTKGAPAAPPGSGPAAAPTTPPVPRRTTAEKARLLGLALVAAYLIAFVVENSKSIDIHFVFFTAHVSLIWALILAALLGMVVDRLVIRRRARRKAAERSR